MRERSLLQIVVAVGGIIPVAAGATGIFLGAAFVDAAVGMSADSHFRYLSGLLLGIGLGFWSTIPHIESDGAKFRLLTFIVFVGGLGRLFALVTVGTPPAGMVAALAMELVVTPLLCLWQSRVLRNSRRSKHQP